MQKEVLSLDYAMIPEKEYSSPRSKEGAQPLVEAAWRPGDPNTTCPRSDCCCGVLTALHKDPSHLSAQNPRTHDMSSHRH